MPTATIGEFCTAEIGILKCCSTLKEGCRASVNSCRVCTHTAIDTGYRCTLLQFSNLRDKILVAAHAYFTALGQGPSSNALKDPKESKGLR